VIKEIRKKGILLVVSLILLLAAGMYMAFAWYTKMTSASEMTFDTAKWEYSANFSSDPIIINIYNSPVSLEDGTTGVAVVSGKAAPGTEGYAPVVLSAGNSDVAVGYTISVDKSLMSDEFKERIYFFQDAAMTTPAGDSWGDASGNGRTVMTGTLQPGETKTVILYWRWVYDSAEVSQIAGGRRTTTATAAEFDAFDTKVGMNPDHYEKDMVAQVLISGTQVQPEADASGSAASGSGS